jgi:glucoamylase
VGERGHYALAAGEDPMPYLEAMMAMGNAQGMIPEQVWDSPPIPEFDLKIGRPSGSAMPLVWAHGEFVKLAYSKLLGSPVDRPAATWKRYGGVKPKIDYLIWGPAYRPRRLRAGHALTIAINEAATVRWTVNAWRDVQDAETHDIGIDIHVVDLPVTNCKPGDVIQFTFQWRQSQAWEGQNYQIIVVG